MSENCPPETSPGSQYELAVKRTLQQLGTSMLATETAERRILAMQEEAERSALLAAKHRKLAALLHAQAIKEQIALKDARNLRARADNQQPGIQPSFSGYPNLPETPDTLRRQLKTERQLELKRALDAQTLAQRTARRTSAAEAVKQEQRLLAQTQRETEEMRLQQTLKKVKDRELLLKSWAEAERAKAVQARIEEIHLRGLDPRKEPIDLLLHRAVGQQVEREEPVEQAEEQQEQREWPVPEEEQKVEPPPAEKVPIPPKPAMAIPTLKERSLDAHSLSFDARAEKLVAPVIQMYHASDLSHATRTRRGLSTSAAVGRYSGLKLPPSMAPRGSGDSQANWAFATETQRSHRSRSNAVKPPTDTAEHHRYHSRPFQFTAVRALQQNV